MTTLVILESPAKVKKVADFSIGLNFKSLLYFQGYSDSEITHRLN